MREAWRADVVRSAIATYVNTRTIIQIRDRAGLHRRAVQETAFDGGAEDLRDRSRDLVLKPNPRVGVHKRLTQRFKRRHSHLHARQPRSPWAFRPSAASV